MNKFYTVATSGPIDKLFGGLESFPSYEDALQHAKSRAAGGQIVVIEVKARIVPLPVVFEVQEIP